jgi:transcriptional regulator with XRE-family HTH domain
MERKTIGEFIAVLRKANGLTQRQLAEKLNVSEKSISRWERNETAPDLALIPVIAELFSVTSDELLRGERIDPTEAAPSPKQEKRLSYMFKQALTRHRIHSIVAVDIHRQACLVLTVTGNHDSPFGVCQSLLIGHSLIHALLDSIVPKILLGTLGAVGIVDATA